MTTLEQVIDAIGTLLESTDPGLHVNPYVPGQTNFPAAFVAAAPVTDYRNGVSDGQVHAFDIVVLVSAALFENARTVLPYLERSGAQSIFAAFEANRSLGFTDVDAHVRESRGLDLQEVAAYNASGAVVTVVVYLD